ncbi:Ig-like domain-containing protein [Methanobrevibacter olleyae]|uniref:Adhesin-like protein n=1 Tax=Methanobrevibacter olleyae TaxID=294671 RepID=A0A126QXG8_METOL|nr:hypothetical protein [Methanobrevibacter olleyae]AMK14731.1 adhesin-like protein [Methanobrevibacter olleyae]
MKSKPILVIILLFLTIIISIGTISADENQKGLLSDMNNSNNTSSIDSSGDLSTNQSSTVATSSKTSSNETPKKISTKVIADPVANEYKKSKYFKVKIKDENGYYLKNVKINLKIYTGSKAKIYTVKTNSKGIAKFNTKSLKLGNHKVAISSANSRYKISKTSKIFIGKKQYVTLKLKTKKVLKNKDVLSLKIKNDEDEKEVDVVYKKTPKFTRVTKAVFYLKNKKTGKIIKKTDSAKFDDGRWELPDKDFSKKYSLVKVKVWYLSSK